MKKKKTLFEKSWAPKADAITSPSLFPSLYLTLCLSSLSVWFAFETMCDLFQHLLINDIPIRVLNKWCAIFSSSSNEGRKKGKRQRFSFRLHSIENSSFGVVQAKSRNLDNKLWKPMLAIGQHTFDICVHCWECVNIPFDTQKYLSSFHKI